MNIKHILDKELIIADKLLRIYSYFFFLSTADNNEFSLSILVTEVQEAHSAIINKKKIKENINWMNNWVKWVDNFWYSDIVKYKINRIISRKESVAEKSSNNMY